MHELTADAFNNETYVPESAVMEGTHLKLSLFMKLPKQEGITITTDKVKGKLSVAKPKLNYIID